MNQDLRFNLVKQVANLACSFVLVLAFASFASAQRDQGGGDLGGGDFGGGNIPITDPGLQDQGDTGNTNTGGGEGDGEIDSVDPIRLGFDIEDMRNQGFVGPTAPYTAENGFVGPPSDNNQLGGLAEERFTGGGTNSDLGNRSATTTSRNLQENGFTVIRKSIRSRLRPAFAAPSTPGFVAVSRFQSRMLRQPVVRNFGSGINVTISNRTAVLTGTVRTEAERQIIKRQLRLEPGVYRIEDRTKVAN